MTCIKACMTLFFVCFFLPGLMQLAHGQSMAPVAAPPMSNDGTTVDQGVAYLLMLIALLVTYLVH
ncbi:Arabinogalactan peptide 16 [Platanthera guangdongensis]|uniref:Arabinogalactan peptide 16 n=1 Tax=Platanthera guangdongensis TaxID=2320717 RepID=A0ABR2M224_9ASPA